MSGHGGARPGAGRPAGQPNKVTREVRLLAQQYGEEAILALVDVMQDPVAPHLARVKAAEALLNRGHGRPTQQVETRISPLEELSDADLLAALAALKELEIISGDNDAAGPLDGPVAGSA